MAVTAASHTCSYWERRDDSAKWLVTPFPAEGHTSRSKQRWLRSLASSLSYMSLQ